MASPKRGEVWSVDLGLAAKVRPCLVISVTVLQNERALFGIIPHTTSVWGTRFEAVVPVGWLENGAFDAQGFPRYCWASAQASCHCVALTLLPARKR